MGVVGGQQGVSVNQSTDLPAGLLLGNALLQDFLGGDAGEPGDLRGNLLSLRQKQQTVIFLHNGNGSIPDCHQGCGELNDLVLPKMQAGGFRIENKNAVVALQQRTQTLHGTPPFPQCRQLDVLYRRAGGLPPPLG